MTIKSYPFLLVLNQSIEFIADQEILEQHLHYLSASQRSEVTCIYTDGSCYNLSGQPVVAISLDRLTDLVKNWLVMEGHCCVQKIQLRNIAEAFALLAE
ncbi:DUF4144 family protein [Pseudoalteromonas sp. T1lg65]|uniref:DUF4144 family protein n=1 Tax=Pseudoalteromonas sp. T1lg65 TaxID=2077101 RepID=UPI003F7913DE